MAHATGCLLVLMAPHSLVLRVDLNKLRGPVYRVRSQRFDQACHGSPNLFECGIIHSAHIRQAYDEGDRVRMRNTPHLQQPLRHHPTRCPVTIDNSRWSSGQIVRRHYGGNPRQPPTPCKVVLPTHEYRLPSLHRFFRGDWGGGQQSSEARYTTA